MTLFYIPFGYLLKFCCIISGNQYVLALFFFALIMQIVLFPLGIKQQKSSVNMAKMMNIPVIGAVENYSYFECPDCGKRHNIYGESRLDEVAAEYDIPVLARLPIDPSLAKLCDEGRLEEISDKQCAYLSDAIGRIFDK